MRRGSIDIAHAIADAESKAAAGTLDEDSRTLSRLIGRPTMTLPEAVAAALKTPPPLIEQIYATRPD
jgi:hypothetical protein